MVEYYATDLHKDLGSDSRMVVMWGKGKELRSNLIRTFSSGFSCDLDKNNVRPVVEAKVQLSYFKEGIRS